MFQLILNYIHSEDIDIVINSEVIKMTELYKYIGSLNK